MAVTMTTSMNEIDNYIKAELERAHRLTLRALSYLGERLIARIRDRPYGESWVDHTGNLRSSIGYIIVHNGQIVQYGGFEGKGTEGSLEGKNLAEQLSTQYRGGYALIVVAGMNYAAKVEALENKDVLASAELYARAQLPELERKLQTQILEK